MAFDYQKEKAVLFTDEGQRMFLRIRDRANKLASESGALTVGQAIRKESGDSFAMLACVERLIEIGEFSYLEVTNTPMQNWIIVPKR